MTKRMSMAIVLPSGIDTGHFSIRVIEDGLHVELTVQWPDVLLDMQLLHRKWLQSKNRIDAIEPYHPKIVGFGSFLKNLRHAHMEKVESTVRIRLPFRVQTHIEGKYNLAWT